MKQLSIFFLAISMLTSCRDNKTESKNISQADKMFTTKSYLEIKLDSNGHLPSNPYILEYKNEKKEIIFCGVEHLTDDNDINNQMFSVIENKFFDIKPNIAINEGGDISKRTYASKKDALLRDGEIGLTKILCDSLKIKTVDGDPTFEIELKELLKKYSKGEILAYIITERLMWSLKGQQLKDSSIIKSSFDKFIQNYFIEKGSANLSIEEHQFNFYKANYEKLVGRRFDLRDLKPTNPLDSTSKFQEIGRSSKEIRDQFLLKKIDTLLDSYDKVFVVFGGWHLLTCEPGLKEIINKKRK